MSKADDEKKRKERELDEKKNGDKSFDQWFDARLDKHLKDKDKIRKRFKHTVHNYTTGLIPLDYAINPTNPGIPGGNIIQLAGPGHAGKSCLSVSIAMYNQRNGGKTIYLDPEDGLEDSMIQGYGSSKYGDPSFKYVEAGSPATHYFDIMKDTLLRLQGEPDPVVFIVDSISYLRPEVETFEKVRVGDNIPFFNNFLRAIRPLIGNTNALMILLNGVYQDNENQHNDYKIPGGETLRRACDLILLHYRRTNPTGQQVGPYELTFDAENKKFPISYRQKLACKIVKNKWHHSDSKFSTLEYMFNNNIRYGPYSLDNTNMMLVFLKDMGVLNHKHQGYYEMDQQKKYWKDWEHECNNNAEVNQLVINKTLATLNELYLGG